MRLRSTLTLIAALAAFGCNPRNGDPDAGTPGMDTGMGGMENTAALCSDGVDNDGDGHIDCNDFGCCALVSCDVTTSCGQRRDGGPPGVACEGPSVPENTPERCSDGCSNDHENDLFVDCADFDCCPHRTDCPPDTPCGMQPRRCEGDPRAENTLPACTNGCSDDDDTFVDCREVDCCWILAEAAERGLREACPTGTYCRDSFTVPTMANLCPDDDLMGRPRPENSYERCSNSCDDNRDAFQDCGDFDCCPIIARAVEAGVAGAVACGAGTACADEWTPRPGVELCPGDNASGEPPEENTLERCSNDCDDDRDGYEDCEDFDCCEVRTDCPSTTRCGRP